MGASNHATWRIDRGRAIARAAGRPACQCVQQEHSYLLAWLMGGGPPVIPVVGASSVAQLDEILGAVDLPLDDDARERLDAAGRQA